MPPPYEQGVSMENRDEFWFYGVIHDFNQVVCSGVWGPKVWDSLSEDAKLILKNMVLLDVAGYDIKCQLESD